MASLDLPPSVRKKGAMDGRHVGLDFYDLLIEAILAHNGPHWTTRREIRWHEAEVRVADNTANGWLPGIADSSGRLPSGAFGA